MRISRCPIGSYASRALSASLSGIAGKYALEIGFHVPDEKFHVMTGSENTSTEIGTPKAVSKSVGPISAGDWDGESFSYVPER